MCKIDHKAHRLGEPTDREHLRKPPLYLISLPQAAEKQQNRKKTAEQPSTAQCLLPSPFHPPVTTLIQPDRMLHA